MSTTRLPRRAPVLAVPSDQDVATAAQVADHQAKRYSTHVTTVAQNLRRLAEDVERLGARVENPSVTGCPRFSQAGQDVMRAVVWGLANSAVDHLPSEAALADHYEAEHQRMIQVRAVAAGLPQATDDEDADR